MNSWCKLFHRKFWWSNDYGVWHSLWHVHHGKFQIECMKCGRVHEGQRIDFVNSTYTEGFAPLRTKRRNTK